MGSSTITGETADLVASASLRTSVASAMGLTWRRHVDRAGRSEASSDHGMARVAQLHPWTLIGRTFIMILEYQKIFCQLKCLHGYVWLGVYLTSMSC